MMRGTGSRHAIPRSLPAGHPHCPAPAACGAVGCRTGTSPLRDTSSAAVHWTRLETSISDDDDDDDDDDDNNYNDDDDE